MPSTLQAALAGQTGTPGGGPLVLVVDDAPINHAVVSLLLHQIGCRALAVESGPAALAAVLAQPIDIVLMDCQMPGMDGYEAATCIRQALPPGRRLPIIALTGHDQPSDRERCRAAGMDDHLVKPLQIAVLRAAIARCSGAEPVPDMASPTAPVDGGAVLLDPTPLASFDRLRPGSGATLLGIYLKDLGIVEASLARAVADGDLHALERSAHKLKGASLTVGAHALAMAMKDLGQQARDGSLPGCQEAWRRTEAVLAQTRAAIHTTLSGGRSRPTVAQPPWQSARATADTLAGQRARVMRSEGLVACLDAMPGLAILLNPQRQIILANGAFQRVLGIDNAASLIGKRPGEALGCHRAVEGPDGCGSHPACAFCGSIQTVMGALRDQVRMVGEARLTIGADTGHALDLELTATPIHLDDHSFVLLAMRDIASEKRRQVLERLFFHDVLNSAGGIHGLAIQLAERRVVPTSEEEVRGMLLRTAQQLVEEIQSQRQLGRAESGELSVDIQPAALATLLCEIRDACLSHPVAAQRSLVLGHQVAANLRTDRVLFRRVLGNLVKNALEATPPGGTVTIGSRAVDGRIQCMVHNPGMMSPAVQLQLFQRSFTTKGEGRGLGTWSAKLLGERYLGGRLSFTSSETAGTELVFTLPVAAP